MKAFTELVHNPTKFNVRKFLASCFYQSYDLQVDYAVIPIRQFVVLLSSLCDGGFHITTTITSKMAAIQYAVRGCVLLDIVTEGKDVLQFLNLDVLTPYSVLLSEYALVKHLSAGETLVNNIHWTKKETFEELEVDGTLVSLSDIRKCYTALIDRVSWMLNHEILFALSCEIPQHLYDEFMNRSSGWSFVNDSRNQLQREKLLQFILDEPNLSKRFLLCGGVWNVCEVARWLKLVSQLLEYILVLIHLSSGMPARATELRSLKNENMMTSSRSVYIYNRKVMLVAVII